jgi:hypothetical protein
MEEEMNANNGWMVGEMARLYREDRLRDAEQYRLAAAAQGEQPEATPLSARLLYHLGQYMANWGASLQNHYRRAAELKAYPAGDCR